MECLHVEKQVMAQGMEKRDPSRQDQMVHGTSTTRSYDRRALNSFHSFGYCQAAGIGRNPGRDREVGVCPRIHCQACLKRNMSTRRLGSDLAAAAAAAMEPMMNSRLVCDIATGSHPSAGPGRSSWIPLYRKRTRAMYLPRYLHVMQQVRCCNLFIPIS